MNPILLLLAASCLVEGAKRRLSDYSGQQLEETDSQERAFAKALKKFTDAWLHSPDLVVAKRSGEWEVANREALSTLVELYKTAQAAHDVLVAKIGHLDFCEVCTESTEQTLQLTKDAKVFTFDEGARDVQFIASFGHPNTFIGSLNLRSAFQPVRSTNTTTLRQTPLEFILKKESSTYRCLQARTLRHFIALDFVFQLMHRLKQICIQTNLADLIVRPFLVLRHVFSIVEPEEPLIKSEYLPTHLRLVYKAAAKAPMPPTDWKTCLLPLIEAGIEQCMKENYEAVSSTLLAGLQQMNGIKGYMKHHRQQLEPIVKLIHMYEDFSGAKLNMPWATSGNLDVDVKALEGEMLSDAFPRLADSIRDGMLQARELFLQGSRKPMRLWLEFLTECVPRKTLVDNQLFILLYAQRIFQDTLFYNEPLHRDYMQAAKGNLWFWLSGLLQTQHTGDCLKKTCEDYRKYVRPYPAPITFNAFAWDAITSDCNDTSLLRALFEKIRKAGDDMEVDMPSNIDMDSLKRAAANLDNEKVRSTLHACVADKQPVSAYERVAMEIILGEAVYLVFDWEGIRNEHDKAAAMRQRALQAFKRTLSMNQDPQVALARTLSYVLSDPSAELDLLEWLPDRPKLPRPVELFPITNAVRKKTATTTFSSDPYWREQAMVPRRSLSAIALREAFEVLSGSVDLNCWLVWLVHSMYLCKDDGAVPTSRDAITSVASTSSATASTPTLSAATPARWIKLAQSIIHLDILSALEAAEATAPFQGLTSASSSTSSSSSSTSSPMMSKPLIELPPSVFDRLLLMQIILRTNVLGASRTPISSYLQLFAVDKVRSIIRSAFDVDWMTAPVGLPLFLVLHTRYEEIRKAQSREDVKSLLAFQKFYNGYFFHDCLAFRASQLEFVVPKRRFVPTPSQLGTQPWFIPSSFETLDVAKADALGYGNEQTEVFRKIYAAMAKEREFGQGLTPSFIEGGHTTGSEAFSRFQDFLLKHLLEKGFVTQTSDEIVLPTMRVQPYVLGRVLGHLLIMRTQYTLAHGKVLPKTPLLSRALFENFPQENQDKIFELYAKCQDPQARHLGWWALGRSAAFKSWALDNPAYGLPKTSMPRAALTSTTSSAPSTTSSASSATSYSARVAQTPKSMAEKSLPSNFLKTVHNTEGPVTWTQLTPLSQYSPSVNYAMQRAQHRITQLRLLMAFRIFRELLVNTFVQCISEVAAQNPSLVMSNMLDMMEKKQ